MAESFRVEHAFQACMQAEFGSSRFSAWGKLFAITAAAKEVAEKWTNLVISIVSANEDSSTYKPIRVRNEPQKHFFSSL